MSEESRIADGRYFVLRIVDLCLGHVESVGVRGLIFGWIRSLGCLNLALGLAFVYEPKLWQDLGLVNR